MDRSLKTVVDKVMAENGLLAPDEIRLLRDRDVLKIPGIGRAAINKIRETYPFDELAVLKVEMRDLRAHAWELRESLRNLGKRPICISCLHGVAAVRVMRHCVLIRFAKFREIIQISIVWHPELGNDQIALDAGFGEMPMQGVVVADQEIMRFHMVRGVSVGRRKDGSERCWSRSMIVWTDHGQYEFWLFGHDVDLAAPVRTKNPVRKPEILGDYQKIEITIERGD
ncbi:hypothetical protein [Paracoccus marinaquae]|uniref:Helix-hairpin-helix domain-containing protein n=1 Tax=Paracoccus marinaquae TaxID=2841926 RepID=A0ABS6AN55_9RHOB|nr:hypothetical protein [Paracoccus marinaquae]MBU3032026.1 hypothetical protein [Paracoccus marinaquae]